MNRFDGVRSSQHIHRHTSSGASLVALGFVILFLGATPTFAGASPTSPRAVVGDVNISTSSIVDVLGTPQTTLPLTGGSSGTLVVLGLSLIGAGNALLLHRRGSLTRG